MGGAGSASKNDVIRRKPEKKTSLRSTNQSKESSGTKQGRNSVSAGVEVTMVNDSLHVVNISELHSVNIEGTFQQQLPSANQQSEKSGEKTPKKGKFIRGEIIGTGAYGKVYKGIDLQTNEEVAIKTVKISDDYEKAKREIKALKDEISILKALSHQNIVKYLYLDISEDNTAVEIVLEYVSGGSLRKLLDKKGKLSEKEASLFLSQILEGLLYLHSRNIIHRDIKGQNVLIEKDGTVKLSDFGTSKQLRIGENDDKDNVESEQLSRSLKGSPYWMAPEVILRTGHSFPADIWSVGCILLEMIVGKPPYSNFSRKPIEVMKIIASGRYPFFPKNISPECKFFLERCIRYDPSERSKVDELMKLPFIRNYLENSAVFINNNFLIKNGNNHKRGGSLHDLQILTNTDSKAALSKEKSSSREANVAKIAPEPNLKSVSSSSSTKFFNQDDMFINSAHAVINGEIEKRRLEEKERIKSLKQQQWEKELQEELALRKKNL